jgi:hypothetical protein
MNYKNFINSDLLEQQYQKSINDVSKMKEIFFVRLKRDRFVVVENGEDVLNIILTNKVKPYKDYYKIDVINFCNAIKKDTCKYQTFKSKKVYKYTLLQSLYDKKIETGEKLVSYLSEFEYIMKNKDIQLFFRKFKFKRILQ